MHKGDWINSLVDAHQGDPQLGFGFPGITTGIDADKIAPHQPCEKGGRSRINQHSTDHITRQGKRITVEIENKPRRRPPQDIDKGKQNNGLLQQINAKIGCRLGQMAGILMQPLVGVAPPTSPARVRR